MYNIVVDLRERATVNNRSRRKGSFLRVPGGHRSGTVNSVRVTRALLSSACSTVINDHRSPRERRVINYRMLDVFMSPPHVFTAFSVSVMNC